eukprot:scaffold91_cov254-Pinguiococcus_pyrenoidosus.AAC.14
MGGKPLVPGLRQRSGAPSLARQEVITSPAFYVRLLPPPGFLFRSLVHELVCTTPHLSPSRSTSLFPPRFSTSVGPRMSISCVTALHMS